MLKKSLWAAAIVLAAVYVPAQAKDIIDLRPAGTAPQTVDSAIGGQFVVAQTQLQPTGTGVIDSFLRIQQNGQERGYNTSLGTPLDDKAPSDGFTRAITLGEIPVVTINGVQYREFLLDANQTSANQFLSLNQLEIFQASSDQLHTGLSEASTTQDAIITFASATEVFRLNNAQNTAGGLTTNREIQLDYTLGSGSGSGDLFFYIRNDAFTQNPNSNIILFSQFGNPSGTYSSNDGFEEWAVLTPGTTPVVPEPATMVLAISGLGTLGFVRLSRPRRKDQATA